MARDISFFDEREKYETDEQFANFRNVTTGNLKENILYRSASPVDNQHNRATYVDDLAQKAGINYILDLADTDERIDSYINNSYHNEYFENLRAVGNVNAIALNTNYLDEHIRERIAEGLMDMIAHDGPYLIHCTEGKDRTGFILILLESLTGASYEELKDDYMKTYENYYGFTKQSPQYEIIVDQVFKELLAAMNNGHTFKYEETDLSEVAIRYLASCGLSSVDIANIKLTLEKPLEREN